MPWSPLALLFLLIGLTVLSVWLLDSGWRRRSLWRLALGGPIALWLIAVCDLMIAGA